jgi:hypothetical protein
MEGIDNISAVDRKKQPLSGFVTGITFAVCLLLQDREASALLFRRRDFSPGFHSLTPLAPGQVSSHPHSAVADGSPSEVQNQSSQPSCMLAVTPEMENTFRCACEVDVLATATLYAMHAAGGGWKGPLARWYSLMGDLLVLTAQCTENMVQHGKVQSIRPWRPP